MRFYLFVAIFALVIVGCEIPVKMRSCQLESKDLIPAHQEWVPARDVYNGRYIDHTEPGYWHQVDTHYFLNLIGFVSEETKKTGHRRIQVSKEEYDFVKLDDLTDCRNE
jgi:hypothetical protein